MPVVKQDLPLLLPWEPTGEELFPWQRKTLDGVIHLEIVLPAATTTNGWMYDKDGKPEKEPWCFFLYPTPVIDMIHGRGPSIKETMHRADSAARKYFRLLSKRQYEKIRTFL